MTNKFDNVKVEEDTLILNSSVVKFGNYDALFQLWAWEGITAESLIFCNEDISDISQDDLKNQIYISDLVKTGCTEITVNEDETYTFFNFNFKHDED